MTRLCGLPGVKVLLLAAAIDKLDLARGLRLGIRGVIFKDTDPALMFKAIRRVSVGQYWVQRETLENRTARHDKRRCRDGALAGGSRFFGLTPREHGIVSASGQRTLQPWNRRRAQAQRRHGRAPSDQHLRQDRCFDSAGTGVVRRPPPTRRALAPPRPLPPSWPTRRRCRFASRTVGAACPMVPSDQARTGGCPTRWRRQPAPRSGAGIARSGHVRGHVHPYTRFVLATTRKCQPL